MSELILNERRPQPNSLFVPQLPQTYHAWQSLTQLIHVKVGLLNVAWQSKENPHPHLNQPPMTQPITLPIQIHIHPTLKAPHVHATGMDAFIPPTLHHLHSSILPSILNHLPDMIAQIKVKKMDTLRGNRVGIIRTTEFVLTFTFKETQPPYHLVTASSKRIKPVQTDSNSNPDQTSSKSHNRPGYSLSSHLTNFDLFADPSTRIELLPIKRSTAATNDPCSHDVEGEGYYQGEGYASYLVSRHTLHVRLVPKRHWVEQIAVERAAESKRRTRLDHADQRFGPATKVKPPEDEMEEDEDVIERLAAEDSDDDFDFDCIPITKPTAAASSTSKQTIVDTKSDTPLPTASLDSFGSLLLPFHRTIIQHLTHQDGLVVLGKGLGIQHIWLGFLAQYLQVLPSPTPTNTLPATLASSTTTAASSAATAATTTPSTASPHLIFLLNFDEDLLQWMNEMFQTYSPLTTTTAAASSDPSQPQRSRGICRINNEFNVSERQQLYLQGGILAITSRILTVDLLNHVIASDLISGFCVHDAHAVSDISPEAFILRIWRKKNKFGWIKAMSDDSSAFSRGTSAKGSTGAFSGLEVIMKALFLRKVWLYPRFTIAVNDSLNPVIDVDEEAEGSTPTSGSRFSLVVEELHQPFSELMTSIQNSLVEVIDTLITQLKSENKHLTVYDHPTSSKSDAATSRTFQSLNLSIEAGLMKNFEQLLKAELNPIQHRLSSKTKSILADISSLRSCISYLINYDCVTFYRYLLLIKSNAINSNSAGGSSTWLLSESADKLFKMAKQRVYMYLAAQASATSTKRQIESTKSKHTPTIKASSSTVSGGGSSKADAMELSEDEETTKTKPNPSPPPPSTSSTDDSIQLVLEENPKWSLLIDTLEEIENDICQRTKQFEQQAREVELGEIMRGHVENKSSTKKEKKVEGQVKVEKDAQSTRFQLPPSFGRTLVLVRDARTATFLTRLLNVGGRSLLKNYWKKYLFSLKLHKRAINLPNHNTKPGSTSTPSSSHVSSSFLQFQRETILLKRELEHMIDIETLDRYRDQQAYGLELQQRRIHQEEEKKKEENVGFDLEDEEDGNQLTLTQLTKKEKEEAAANAAKRKEAREAKKKASTTASASVDTAKPNPYKGGGEAAIEALEREVDEDMTTADKRPQLQWEPHVKSPTTAVKGKRGSKAISSDKDSRKKAKTKESGSEDAVIVENEGAGEDSAMDESVRVDVDEADADMLLFFDENEEKLDRPLSSGGLPTHLSSMPPSDGPSTSSSFLFDRSDYSVIDPNFKMDTVPKTTSAPPMKSPFFTDSIPTTATSSVTSHLTSSTTVIVLPSYQLLVHPLKHLHSILHHYAPEYVIIFDPDIICIRELEIFQALPTTNWQLHVYFMLYSNSIEEQRYITSIEQENKAFEHLIQTKKNMIIPTDQDGKLPDAPLHAPTPEEKKNSSLYEDGVRNATYEAYAATLPKTLDTRRGGTANEGPGTILVDVREFRSSLPSLLHAANLVVQPVTLEIADYILTPTLAIERKSVPDLIGSLASGRLYKQMEQAIRYYKTPVLLIEFDRSRPFMLISKSDLSSEISGKSVLSKLALLILHFPQMRILWSRDSYATTNMFVALKQKQLQPTVEQAVTANSNALKSSQVGYEFADLLSSAGLTEDEKDERNLSLTPHDILRKLPGVTASNIRTILQHCNNLRQLCEASMADLTKWLGGNLAAKKLYTFLHDEP